MRPLLLLVVSAGSVALCACSAGRSPQPVDEVVVIAHAPLPAATQSSRALPADEEPQPAPALRPQGETPGMDGLVIEDVLVGTGREVVVGDKITVHYVGRLVDGTEFDNSWKRASPAQFPIGRGMLIQGWDKGLIGMRVGGRRRLTVPPSLGYGAAGRPPVIPQSATLLFDIELISIP